MIAYLFYIQEYRFFYDKLHAEMEMDASRLASQIITAHMSGSKLSLNEVVDKSTNKVGFYNSKHEPIASNIESKIDFSKEIYEDGNRMFLINKSTLGHLGVYTIVIERDGIGNFVTNLQKKIILSLFLIYIILAIVGYFLAKLFIKPIQMKRIQLDNFIKDSTHELNTPITALMLSIESPRLVTPKNIERIKLSANRISEIHKDLSYLMLESKTNRAKIVKDLYLNEVIKEELRYLSLLAEKRRVKLTVNYIDDIYFKIDRESFIRLIHNLISNSIKYNTINGYIYITLEKNSITIKDTGIGIHKEHQSEIYKRFYRATNKVGGFGLGLNIVYNVCRDYGIKIDFKSEVDIGTTFILTF